MRTALDAGGGARGAAEALAQMLAPFAPFAAEELWREVLGHDDSVHVGRWPSFDTALASEDTITLVVQVDGRSATRSRYSADTDEARVPELARARESTTGDRRPRDREGRSSAHRSSNFVTR